MASSSCEAIGDSGRAAGELNDRLKTTLKLQCTYTHKIHELGHLRSSFVANLKRGSGSGGRRGEKDSGICSVKSS